MKNKNKWSRNFEDRPHRRFFTGKNIMWHRPFGSNAVGCSRFCCVHRSSDSVLFNGPDNPQNCPFPLGIWTPSTCNTWFIEPTRVNQGRLHKGGMVRDAPWRKVGGFFVNNDAFAIMYYYCLLYTSPSPRDS